MKKNLVVFTLIVLCATGVSAQKETKKFSVGFGFEGGVPTGSYSNAYTSDIGITIRFSWLAGPGFVTLTTGAIGLVPKKVVGQSEKVGLQLPVRAGYKIIIQHHFFVMGELGYASTKVYYGSQGKVLSASQGSFLVAPAIGVQFNAFEIALRYESHSGDGGALFGPRIGFNF
ncbi:MAG: hypothetical protein Q8927_00860 [Bacteroidota bacterium]|nr:hypothetical protein [Bacteroidota bacterium]MDP4214717.1 hypothetical protein [Bacteroidota bacterium]MDP4246866.1 hypothetical protein [Bacteroidota bacterium]MDP4255819.1 hypothetical protein [Bacteroidota bacterium]MDP4257694.1 hypothetical protein [Bacteroidota bacterium]